ncbi:MAG: 4'-phosphopantetheinyl transferase family protein [Bacillota bacterium]
MNNIYAVNIIGFANDRIKNVLLKYISEERKEKIKKFKNDMDGLRSLLSEAMIRYILIRYYNIENDSIRIKYNHYGKPYIEKYENIHYNISHAGEWVVCAVHDSPVGIDIEKIQIIDIKIAKRFFAPTEYEYIKSSQDYDTLKRFYDIWTLKESFLKALGCGLSKPLNSFSITIDDYDIKLKNGDQVQDFYFKMFDIEKIYKLSICSSTNNFPEEIDFIKGDELLKAFC